MSDNTPSYVFVSPSETILFLPASKHITWAQTRPEALPTPQCGLDSLGLTLYDKTVILLLMKTLSNERRGWGAVGGTYTTVNFCSRTEEK